MNHSKLSYSQMHPIVLHGTHPMTKLIIEAEHLRLMHAGPTLLASSLSRRYHIIGLRKTVRSVTRQCVTCKRHSARPSDQLLGQVPAERGVHYLSACRKCKRTKANLGSDVCVYVCVCVCVCVYVCVCVCVYVYVYVCVYIRN